MSSDVVNVISEMSYVNDTTFKVLAKGSIEGFDFCIISRGTHPTAYVRIPKGHRYYKKQYYDLPVLCHWGFSFSAEDLVFNPVELKDSWWVGWDYAHIGDYVSCYNETVGILNADSYKKWSTQEILSEVKNVIKQLKEVEQ